nr:MAG TPA: hypothetical protein [Caudoviricetes sp.]
MDKHTVQKFSMQVACNRNCHCRVIRYSKCSISSAVN